MANRPAKNQNNINRWLNRYFSALIATFFLAFLLAAYFVIILPKAQLTKEAIEANLLAEKNLYEQSKKKLASLKALEEIYSQFSPAELGKFNAVLPADYPPERIFGELEEIVSRGGWQIVDISLASDQDEEVSGETQAAEASVLDGGIFTGSSSQSVGTVNIDLTVRSIDYPGFKQLVRMLENNLRLFDIVNVRFTPGENIANFKIRTYYYKSVE